MYDPVETGQSAKLKSDLTLHFAANTLSCWFLDHRMYNIKNLRQMVWRFRFKYSVGLFKCK